MNYEDKFWVRPTCVHWFGCAVLYVDTLVHAYTFNSFSQPLWLKGRVQELVACKATPSPPATDLEVSGTYVPISNAVKKGTKKTEHKSEGKHRHTGKKYLSVSDYRTGVTYPWESVHSKFEPTKFVYAVIIVSKIHFVVGIFDVANLTSQNLTSPNLNTFDSLFFCFFQYWAVSGPWAVHYSRCICQYRYVCIRVCSRSHLGSMTPTKFWQGHSWRTGNKQSTGQWELNREQAGAHTTSHPKNGLFTFDFDFDFYFWFWLWFWFWFWFWLWFWKWTLLKIWIHLIDIHFDSICQYRYVYTCVWYVCIHVCSRSHLGSMTPT